MSGSIEMPGNISMVFLSIVSDSTTQEGKIPPWSRFLPDALAISADARHPPTSSRIRAAFLKPMLKLYCAYYEQSRTHLSLNKDAPIPSPIAAPVDGRVVAIPQVGGLHHRYKRQAA